MRKATVTYNAAEGESQVVTTRGVTFFDGHPQELNTNDHGALITKCHDNPHFDVELGEEIADEPKRKPGRPPKPKEEVDQPANADAGEGQG
jgi:hypothetical protein